VLACHFALSAWPLDRVLVIPSFKHPFGKPLEPYEHRVKMCELAFAHLGMFVTISRIEEELGGVSYTVETLRALKQQNPAAELRLIIGGDILQDAEKWRAFDEVKSIAPLLVIPRLQEGRALADKQNAACYLPDVSSSDIRARLLAGQPLHHGVPLAVQEYIAQHGLYSG
jgi:nicotinate-nucleotide adenylyltransferase